MPAVDYSILGWAFSIGYVVAEDPRPVFALVLLTALPDGSKLGRSEGILMKPVPLLAILLVSALGFGQRSLKNSEKFDVSDLSASDSPISFTGTTKILKTGTACVVTAHNNSTQSLLAVRATVDAATRYGDQPVAFRYDGFFKESLITPSLDFDMVDEGMFAGVEETYVNGVMVERPPQKFVCHAKVKVEFIQFEDGSTWGDYAARKDVMERRTKNMAILTHLVEAYDTGGQTAFDAALDAPELKEKAFHMKDEAEFFKTTMIGLAKMRLAAGQKRQASGVF